MISSIFTKNYFNNAYEALNSTSKNLTTTAQLVLLATIIFPFLIGGLYLLNLFGRVKKKDDVGQEDHKTSAIAKERLAKKKQGEENTENKENVKVPENTNGEENYKEISTPTSGGKNPQKLAMAKSTDPATKESSITKESPAKKNQGEEKAENKENIKNQENLKGSENTNDEGNPKEYSKDFKNHCVNYQLNKAKRALSTTAIRMFKNFTLIKTALTPLLPKKKVLKKWPWQSLQMQSQKRI